MRIQNLRTLDLHGFTYDEAYLKCHRFLNDNWGHDLYIITGNSTRMKEIAAEVIDKYRLRYLVGGITGSDGYIRVFRRTNE